MTSTASLDGPMGTLVELGIVTLVIVGLEVVARLFAPKEEQDPRLGFVAFWLSVAIVAFAMHLFWPLIRQRDNWLERVLNALYWAGWAAWKAGFLAGERGRPQRDHEQIWATTVGGVAGVVIHDFLTGSSA